MIFKDNLNCEAVNVEKSIASDLKNKNLFVNALAEVFTNIKVINSQKADAYFSYRLAGKGEKSC